MVGEGVITGRGNKGAFFDTDNILFLDVAHRMTNIFCKEPALWAIKFPSQLISSAAVVQK